jgi:hypothetical protein
MCNQFTQSLRFAHIKKRKEKSSEHSIHPSFTSPLFAPRLLAPHTNPCPPDRLPTAGLLSLGVLPVWSQAALAAVDKRLALSAIITRINASSMMPKCLRGLIASFLAIPLTLFGTHILNIEIRIKGIQRNSKSVWYPKRLFMQCQPPPSLRVFPHTHAHLPLCNARIRCESMEEWFAGGDGAALSVRDYACLFSASQWNAIATLSGYKEVG